MNELSYHCSIYIKALENETMKETANRLERILSDLGLEYQMYDLELRNEDGNVLETE